jgi:hypothetical protein
VPSHSSQADASLHHERREGRNEGHEEAPEERRDLAIRRLPQMAADGEGEKKGQLSIRGFDSMQGVMK